MRNKSSSLINLIGLSTGLACALMIYLWVQDELNINRFDLKDDRRYQVFTNHQFDTGIQTAEAATGMLVQTLANVIPEIEYVVCYHHFGNKIPLSTNGINIRSNGVFASKDFFKVFNFPLLSGKIDQVLSTSDNIAISEGLAIRLFGQTDNLLGKPITIASNQTLYQAFYLSTYVKGNTQTISSGQAHCWWTGALLAEGQINENTWMGLIDR